MPSTGANKRVTISSVTDLVIPMAASGECETGEQPPISPPHGSQLLYHRHHHQSISSSSSCSQSNDDYIIRKRELLRLESLVRCQVQSQWQLSIENYSKLRKRQSSQLSSLDIEMADCSVSSAPGQTTTTSADPESPSAKELQQQVSEDEYHESDFGHKPSLWRKTIRSVLLRLRGEQQHKDVYVMPQHLRAQLKQMYVY